MGAARARTGRDPAGLGPGLGGGPGQCAGADARRRAAPGETLVERTVAVVGGAVITQSDVDTAAGAGADRGGQHGGRGDPDQPDDRPLADAAGGGAVCPGGTRPRRGRGARGARCARGWAATSRWPRCWRGRGSRPAGCPRGCATTCGSPRISTSASPPRACPATPTWPTTPRRYRQRWTCQRRARRRGSRGRPRAPGGRAPPRAHPRLAGRAPAAHRGRGVPAGYRQNR